MPSWRIGRPRGAVPRRRGRGARGFTLNGPAGHMLQLEAKVYEGIITRINRSVTKSNQPQRKIHQLATLLLITVKVVSPLRIYSVITNTYRLDEIKKN